MKTTLFILLFIFGSSFFFCQIHSQVAVVSDPKLTALIAKQDAVAKANQAKQIAQGIAQIEQLQAQTITFSEILNNVKKVSSFISTSAKVKNIITNQYSLISSITTQMSNAGKNKTDLDLYNSYISELQTIISQNQENIDELLRVTTDGTYKLSDYERLQMIDKIDNRTTELKQLASDNERSYNSMNNMFKMVNTK